LLAGFWNATAMLCHGQQARWVCLRWANGLCEFELMYFEKGFIRGVFCRDAKILAKKIGF
jgi:hypothetical protein